MTESKGTPPLYFPRNPKPQWQAKIKIRFSVQVSFELEEDALSIYRRNNPIIARLYYNQNVEIKIDGILSEEIAICKGIYQESVLSSPFYSTCTQRRFLKICYVKMTAMLR